MPCFFYSKFHFFPLYGLLCKTGITLSGYCTKLPWHLRVHAAELTLLYSVARHKPSFHLFWGNKKSDHILEHWNQNIFFSVILFFKKTAYKWWGGEFIFTEHPEEYILLCMSSLLLHIWKSFERGESLCGKNTGGVKRERQRKEQISYTEFQITFHNNSVFLYIGKVGSGDSIKKV